MARGSPPPRAAWLSVTLWRGPIGHAKTARSAESVDSKVATSTQSPVIPTAAMLQTRSANRTQASRRPKCLDGTLGSYFLDSCFSGLKFKQCDGSMTKSRWVAVESQSLLPIAHDPERAEASTRQHVSRRNCCPPVVGDRGRRPRYGAMHGCNG
jgi:hypothetical protein